MAQTRDGPFCAAHFRLKNFNSRGNHSWPFSTRLVRPDEGLSASAQRSRDRRLHARERSAHRPRQSPTRRRTSRPRCSIRRRSTSAASRSSPCSTRSTQSAQGAVSRAARGPVINRFGLGTRGRVEHLLQYAGRRDLRGDDHGPQAAATLIEVGSGFSTLIARKAVSFARTDTRIVVYDPFPGRTSSLPPTNST